jgi:hypothetical protein
MFGLQTLRAERQKIARDTVVLGLEIGGGRKKNAVEEARKLALNLMRPR